MPKEKWDLLGKSLTDLDKDTRYDLEDAIESKVNGATFFQRENPFVRHIVLRKRKTLEDAGLLKKIAVDIHPSQVLAKKIHRHNALFEGLGLRTTPVFLLAYEEALNYGKAMRKKARGTDSCAT